MRTETTLKVGLLATLLCVPDLITSTIGVFISHQELNNRIGAVVSYSRRNEQAGDSYISRANTWESRLNTLDTFAKYLPIHGIISFINQ